VVAFEFWQFWQSWQFWQWLGPSSSKRNLIRLSKSQLETENMLFRWTQLTILIVVVAIPVLSQNASAGFKVPSFAMFTQSNQDADHQSSAIQQNDDRDRAMSQVQSGVPAPSVSDQAEARLARERSSNYVYWSSTSALAWGLLAFWALVVVAGILWHSGRRFADESRIWDEEVRRAA
jgi:hypothetical protein